MVTINNFEEMNLFYVKEVNTYIFKDDVEFTFDLEIEANIDAYDIKAQNIKAIDIEAQNIKAYDIKALDIKAWNIEAWNIEAIYIIVLNIEAYDIKAYDIKALDIKAWNIEADDSIIAAGVKITGDIKGGDIKARNIEASNITYFAVCFAYCDIICKSINGKRENHKHFVLDGEIIFEPNILC